ncbi:MAG: hypothetical protein JWP58_969 [Hymenobacter sp.]|nr:hypothetical protein [Hymenobacter sp.]
MEQYLPLGLAIGAGSILALMCYQDWQARSISWPAFPALGVALVALHLLRAPAAEVAGQVAVSWAALAILLAALTVYVRLRFRNLRLWDCLGSGDVLYWVVAALYFAPAGFLLYFLGSSVVALITAAVAQWHRPVALAAFRIPLAGVQAACLLLVLGIQYLAPAWPAPGSDLDRLTLLLS